MACIEIKIIIKNGPENERGTPVFSRAGAVSAITGLMKSPPQVPCPPHISSTCSQSVRIIPSVSLHLGSKSNLC